MSRGKEVKIGALNDAVEDVLKEYAEYVSEGVADKAYAEAAEWAAEELRSTSPRRTGQYAASWDSERSYRKSKGTKVGYVVYANAPHYRLTHLLEKGHATRNGGRVSGQPHIAAVEKNVGNEVVDRIKEAIK